MRDINPDGALPLFIGGGDHVVVRGCKNYTSNIKKQGFHTDPIPLNYPFPKTKPILAKTISIFRETISNRISI